MADPTPESRPNVLELERYLLGELSPERAAALEALEASDPDFGEQVRLMRADDAAARLQYPPKRLAAEIEARAGVTPGTRKKGSWLSWAAPLAATAVVMYVALPQDRPLAPEGAGVGIEEGVRPKASAEALEPKLRVYRDQSGEPEALADGAAVSPGDVIQVAYQAGDQAHGVIVSVDGAGAVSLHWPPQADGPTALDGGGEHKLERAWALDDAPGFERFWFVTGPLPLDVEAVVEAARDIAESGLAATSPGLPIQQRVEQQSLLLRKPDRR